MPAKRPKLLSSTRPSTASKGTRLSSRTTQSIITRHHTLHKQLSQARAVNDDAKAVSIWASIAANGGLKVYQQASTQGQSKDRGGDTSKVLVQWLDIHQRPRAGDQGTAANAKVEPLRVLEIGALSTQNALNIPGVTKVRRVDLHSQHAQIEEGDFMDMNPHEIWEDDVGYDVLSLSLVVNYVPDLKMRGEMLRHTVGFLGSRERCGKEGSVLFLVLPLPCVDNSRYLTEEHLEEMMNSIGYNKSHIKRSKKLFYSLWELRDVQENLESRGDQKAFKKTELRKGKGRNNFCIILDSP